MSDTIGASAVLGAEGDTITIVSPDTGGMLFFHMMGALAEFERALISERTRAGMAAARARGVKLGRPPKLGDSDIVEAQRLLSAGEISRAGLAVALEVSPATLTRALRQADVSMAKADSHRYGV